jgi:predicted nucleotidyltransferase
VSKTSRAPAPGRPAAAGEAAVAASGRFLLRLDPELHAELREAARVDGVSLNEYCARKLAAPAGPLASDVGAGVAVRRAASFFGAELIAVVVFGSWARGEAVEGSDVDLLVVVEDGVELSRELYRRWDAEALRWDGREVDVHVAHLPDPEGFSPGLWGEVAIDGVVLYDRGLRLSSRLAGIRACIAEGKLVRRFAQGQPYWVNLRESGGAEAGAVVAGAGTERVLSPEPDPEAEPSPSPAPSADTRGSTEPAPVRRRSAGGMASGANGRHRSRS